MRLLRPLVISVLLIAGCGFNAHSRSPLHHPDLSLAAVAHRGAANNRLFDTYQRSGPVRWNQDWPWKFDLSGVAWDSPRAATAITPRHVIMAAHYMRKVGEELVFHDRKGRPHRRTLIKRVTFKDVGKRGDIGVGLLDLPLPRSVRTYPLLEPKQDYRQLINGALALVTDQERRLYFHRIQQAGETALFMRYADELDATRRKRLIVGDSGNPTFILTAGELALIGTHTSGGPGVGPFYGSREIQSTLGAIIKQLDPAHTFRTVPIDRKVLKESEESGVGKPVPRDPKQKPIRPAGATPPEQGDPPRKPRPRTVVPPLE